MEQFLAALFGIVIINLLLSGDNALVIGMAVRGLPAGQKHRAVVIGGAGAVLLRLVLTALAALLLQIPLLQAAGGLVLAWITYRLLLPGGAANPAAHTLEISFGAALRTIIIADLTMSTDNVLAVGAAAHGDIPLLLIGLVLSMAIILAGGSLVAVLLERLTWLVYVGAGVLLLVAGDLMAADPLVAGALGDGPWLSWALSGLLGCAVLAALGLRRLRPPPAGRPVEAERDIIQV